MNPTVRRFVTQAFSWALLAAVAAAGLALIVVPKASHARPLTVLSGSMAGTYDPGDVVIVKDVDASKVRVGDVITFQPVSDRPDLTTHRVVDIAYGSEGTTYVTKGDANDAIDPWTITAEQVRGRVWYSVPVVGYVSVWMAGLQVRTAINALAVGLLLYGACSFVLGLRDRRRPRVPAAQAPGRHRAGRTR